MKRITTLLGTERVSVIPVTPANSAPLPRASVMRIVGTCTFLVSTSGPATDTTSAYVPANTVEYISVPNGVSVSVLAETGTVGTNYVYLTEVV